MASKTILCPYCYTKFENTDALYQCENNQKNADGSPRCTPVDSKKYNEFWQIQNPIPYWWPQKKGLMSKLFGGTPTFKDQRCPKCRYPSSRFICPHCHNIIPNDMIEDGAKIISVIGSPSSGKTNYIVSLIHELREYGHKVKLSVIADNTHIDGDESGSTDSKYRAFEKALFDRLESGKERRVLDKTQIKNVEVPMIFRLDQQEPKHHIYLVFYDTAGERFQENLKNNVRYLRESSAVIILLDTLALDRVYEILEEEGLDGLGGKVDGKIDEIQTAIVNSRITDQIYSKPTAFVLSKFDAVLDHYDKLDINVDEFMDGGKRIDSSYKKTGMVDLEKINAISATIENALEGPWEQGRLRLFAHNWASAKNKALDYDEQDMFDPQNNYKFFGVSALGEMPDETMRLSDNIKPYRVMDPLMWVLYKLGEFKIKFKN